MSIKLEVVRGILAQVQDHNPNICPPLPGIGGNPKQPAAVLMLLFQDQGKWNLLFIKRTQHKDDRHSGQIAFPGGRSEPSDSSLLDTALREASEEIGVDPGDVEILGQSCPMTTVTDYQITPFVGLLPWPYSFKLSELEVEKIITIPVLWLANPKNHEVKSWKSNPNSRLYIPVIFFNEYEGETLWGATAQIVLDFLELIQLL